MRLRLLCIATLFILLDDSASILAKPPAIAHLKKEEVVLRPGESSHAFGRETNRWQEVALFAESDAEVTIISPTEDLLTKMLLPAGQLEWTPRFRRPVKVWNTSKVAEVEVRFVAESSVSATGEDIVGVANVKDVEESWRKLARGVSVLEFVELPANDEVSTSADVYNCTGILLGAGLIMTNFHCLPISFRMNAVRDLPAELPSDGKRPFAGLYLDATGEGEPVAVREVVDFDETLDVAILRAVSATRLNAMGSLELGRTNLVGGAELAVIQYWARSEEIKMSDDEECKFLRLNQNYEFVHQCDTNDQSSGSPIFLRHSQRLVGIHRLGFVPSQGFDQQNRATRADRVVEWILGRCGKLSALCERYE